MALVNGLVTDLTRGVDWVLEMIYEVTEPYFGEIEERIIKAHDRKYADEVEKFIEIASKHMTESEIKEMEICIDMDNYYYMEETYKIGFAEGVAFVRSVLFGNKK